MSSPTPQPLRTGTPSLPVANPTFSVEDTIEHYIGNFGWKHFYQTTIISMALFFDAYNTFPTIFTDATPNWSLKNSTTKHNSMDICRLPPDMWSWVLPAHSSTISEWALQCASPIVRGLPASTFLIGTIAGALVMATLADLSHLGRKNLLVVCCMIMSVAGTLTSVSVNIWMYSGMRFMSGFGRGPISVCSIVLASELCGRKWRDRVGICSYVWFALGFVSVPIVAFLLRGRSWRLIYLAGGITGIIYSLLMHFTAKESPRWLFIRGKKKEFVRTLKSLSSNTELSENMSENLQSTLDQDRSNTVSSSSLKELLKKRWALQRLVMVTVVTMGLGMTYYGMPLGLGNLSFNLYTSTILNALVEFPAFVAAFYIIGRFKRKGTMIGLCVLSGICGLGSVLVRNKGIQLGLELLAFFGGVTALDVVMIYALELFPTCVRNTAVMGPRVGVLIGGAISPVLVAAAGKKGNEWLSYAVFGVAVLGSGVCVAWLPETRGSAWSDTIDEEERKNGGQ